jgi:tetratricopeptide (TPR) repeat protein
MSSRLPGVCFLVALLSPAASAQIGGPPLRTTSPWYFNRPNYTLRPDVSPYGNPYYRMPTGPAPRPMSSLTAPLLRPPSLLFTPYELERRRSSEAREWETGYLGQGWRAFVVQDYRRAGRDWRYAVAASPADGIRLLLLGQAHFQTGNFAGAGATVRLGLAQLPPEKQGRVIAWREQLYPDLRYYAMRMRELEAARLRYPDDARLRLLLGYQYAFLGWPEGALKELDRAVALKPRDEIVRQFRDRVAALARR